MQFSRLAVICRSCKVSMLKHSVQTVDGPKHTPVQVQIFECPNCKKLRAEEISSSSNAGEAA
jgi:hypothetical protein